VAGNTVLSHEMQYTQHCFDGVGWMTKRQNNGQLNRNSFWLFLRGVVKLVMHLIIKYEIITLSRD